MKSIPLISVIVPIYGVEKYIERCARSIFEQTYQNIEIIFVNDCTSDKSMDILDNVIQEYPNVQSKVQIINHDINCGLAAARKTGLLAAKGKYVIQWDSDDYVDVQFLEKMVALADKEDADITICDMNNIYKNGTIYVHTNPSLDNIECMKQVLVGKVHGSVCNKLIRRSLYVDNNIYPTEGLNMCEDLSVIYRLLFFANKLAYLPEALYNYDLRNEASYTSVRMNAKYQLNFCDLLRQMDEFKIQNNMNKELLLNFKYRKISILSLILLYGDLELFNDDKYLFDDISLEYIIRHPNLLIYHRIASILWCTNFIFLLRFYRRLIAILQGR